MANIFITGVTGFVGSHITEALIKEHNIIALKRGQSNLGRCDSFKSKIKWVNIEDNNWENEVTEFLPNIIIHTAWIGINATEREDWKTQVENIYFLQQLLKISEKCGVAKFIAIGSQAEYGLINASVKEEQDLHPTSAYGAVKIICSKMLQKHCELTKIAWFWLRVFSVFGEREDNTWLIPSIVLKMTDGISKSMDFSPCEQVYAYLYIKNFAIVIQKIVDTGSIKNSAVYNISSSHEIKLKKLIETIGNKLNPAFKLNFGKLPYRFQQPMFIKGDTAKFISNFGEFENDDFERGLIKTIEYYTKNQKHESI